MPNFSFPSAVDEGRKWASTVRSDFNILAWNDECRKKKKEKKANKQTDQPRDPVAVKRSHLLEWSQGGVKGSIFCNLA